ncbi:TPA: hypothetical protein SMN72_001410 [Proteus mirabilis]|uniref:hypothetical protein n=1 Tax=Proteus mirabilis TaxID=584 RepID=UPI000D56FFFB|nr:hypothetical protein [Proteus mirabilis]ELA9706236.1 hypothetical protein [Proteus mirabilis]MBG5993275.1 hypothetical protein [Proteus mirabilis]PVF70713.1 hypothetical protein CSC14_0023 [Proteus mirabilis]PVF71892.1 hypothetical protein CSC14_1228 [Proteus mirabilis]HEJ9809354.1 hypothetical protein [Proteus mirabilis]
MGKGGKKSGNKAKVTIAQAVRDVLLRAMSTGQLVPLTLAAIVVIYLVRMPAEALPALSDRILDAMIDRSLLGYILFVLVVFLWAWHASVMRKAFSAETTRLGNEKSKYQQDRTKHSLGTSDK